MIFNGNYGRARLLAALCILSFVLFNQTTQAQGYGYSNRQVVLNNWASMSGSAFIDSFDSSDPAKSTASLYDPNKRQMNGSLSLLNSTGTDLRNCFIYGNVEFSGPMIKGTANVTGTISTPFSAIVPAANDPGWAPGSFTQYAGGQPATSPANTFTAFGPADNPTRIKVVGDFNVPGGKTFQIVPGTLPTGWIEIWVTGKVNVTGSAKIVQDPGVHVTWIVDKDVSLGAASYDNQSGKAANVSLIAVGTGKMNISGYGNLIATLTAPGRDFTFSGGAAMSGKMYGNTLMLKSSSAIHCDEALNSN